MTLARPSSLKLQLLTGLVATGLLMLFIQLWVASRSTENLAQTLMVSRLEHDGESMILHFIKQENLSEIQIYQRSLSGHYFGLFDAQGKALALSPSLAGFSLPQIKLNPAQEYLAKHPGPLAQKLLVWGYGFHYKQHDYTLLVAEDMQPVLDSIESYRQQHYPVFVLVFLLVLGLIQGWIIWRAFKPVKQAIAQLESVKKGQINAITQALPAELAPLAAGINRFIEHQHQQLKRSRQFAGNLSHALKNPLTLLRNSLSGQTDAQEQLDKMHQLMQRELHRAQIAGPTFQQGWFDWHHDLDALLNSFNKLYPSISIELANVSSLEAQSLQIERQDMLELLGNLLDNACKWATTQVKLSWQDAIDESEFLGWLCIEDDGQGVESEQMSQLTKRGLRLDETTQGSGLGLSIVEDLCQAYDWSIKFDKSALGGLSVCILIPRPKGA